MARRRKSWTARLTGWGHRMIQGGSFAVFIQVRVTEPETQEGRVIYIEITPDLARHLAGRLERHAEDAENRVP